MKRGAREQGAAAFGAGLLCWGVNLGLTLAAHMFSPALVIFGALGLFTGAVLLVWGESFKTMPASQKIPAALIALAVVALAAVPLARWLSSLK
jgi:hypothetical protein